MVKAPTFITDHVASNIPSSEVYTKASNQYAGVMKLFMQESSFIRDIFL